MEDARARTLRLTGHLGDAQLEAVISPILSPLAWDLGHIAAYEDLWINHRLGGLPLLRPGFAELYDAFETPRAIRGDLDFLRGDELRGYLDEVRDRARGVEKRDGTLHELVLRHELQHTETMLQAMALGDLLPPGFAGPAPVDGDGLELVDIAAGAAEIGAPAEGFAYDNERPRHTVGLPAYAIARTPVTNATWLSFAEGGGYERREWWSREAWAWKEDYDITHHEGARTGPPDSPVVHVSWFEADAFARAHDARLPTEFEWEKAATWGQLEGVGAVWEWGPRRGSPATRASRRSRTASTPSRSSAPTTGCCAAGPAPPTPAWAATISAAGTCRSAGSSSRGSGSRGRGAGPTPAPRPRPRATRRRRRSRRRPGAGGPPWRGR
jgi:iron(II)-dependent oxidoreductase